MKNIVIPLVLFVLICSCASSQKKEIVFDPIVLQAKETSLYTDNINWEVVNAKFIELTKGKESVEELKEGLQYLINSLEDKHGAIRSSKNYSLIVSYTGEAKSEKSAERNSEFVNTVINDITAKFSYKYLDNGIGYLNVVGIGPGDVKEQADFIRQGLVQLKAKNVDKWILDLRFNGGGNMEPMIAGLAPLIGNGKIGGAVNNKKEATRTYRLENGQFNNNGRVVCEMDNKPTINPSEKVAVLLSRYTASSGELVAVTFKGRANTKFIGENTAGYTTGNGADPINDELILVISQDIFADRNDKAYIKNVEVDDYVEFQHNIDFNNDNQILKAINWLNE